MQFPKLTPLQSRLAASLIACVILILIYLSIDPSNFAYAGELDSLNAEDHNYHRLIQDALLRTGLLEEGGLEEQGQEDHMSYEPEFVGVSRDIIGRATDDSYTDLGNNAPDSATIEANNTLIYRFQNTTLWGNYSESTPGLPSPVDKRSIEEEEYRVELRRRGLNGDENADEGNYEDLEERDTGESRTVYISMNVCSQPGINGTTTADLAQLTMYVSTSESNTSPGPDSTGTQATATLTGGFVSYTTRASSNVYIGVSAPELPDGYSGSWTYQVAASIDSSFHKFNERAATDQFVYLVDSDTNSALFTTNNLTQADPEDIVFQEWMNAGTPFRMFAYSANNTAIKGLERSYCGLQEAWNQQPTSLIAGMTTRGMGNKPKEEFYIQGLNGSDTYIGFPAMYGNSTTGGSGVVGGGGQVWTSVEFTTKADGNCQVIFNLTFCDEVAYAVPSNPTKYNVTTLTSLYDDYAADLYQNFNYSLQQIPCNTTNTAKYSLARSCDDCANDYKNWLCAVTIPRCEDFSAPDTWLQPRNVAAPFINGSRITAGMWAADPNQNNNASLLDRLYSNSSRNPIIDTDVQPGPYKEVLPCEDLCYSLVQSCPASFGFGCPLAGRGRERSYGNRDGNGDGNITCSYLGAYYYINAVPGSWDADVAVRSAVVAAIAVVLVGLV